jgi:HK97 family phage prohead protease
MLKYLAAAEFKREARLGAASGSGVQLSSVSMRGIDEKARTASFVFSDGRVDRAGDRINPLGWALADFRRNPVALFAHDSKSLPVGRARNVRIDGDRLVGDIEFARPETSIRADQVWRMVRDGYVSAVSVGFQPIKWAWARDPARPMGIDFERQALLEISVVTVPAHQGALLVGADAKKANVRRRRELELIRLRHGN